MQRPNIVLIMADDLGYGDLGVFGDGSSRTPHLDAFAAEGVCLTQHYSASAVCAPARASLLTGRYPHRTGAIDTLEGRGLDRLALRERTLADLLKTGGYATGLVGKWHLGALDARYHPNRRGFDEFAGFRGGWSDYYTWRLDHNGAFRPTDGRYLTDVFTDEAVRFIERHRQEPFFLHLAYNAPHFPLQAPEADIAPFRDTGRFTEGVSTLYGMIQHMDAGIGRVFAALDAAGLRDNTLVLFTSDNGPQFAYDGESLVRFNAHLAGSKGNVFEGGIRVPALLRWPEGLDGGRTVGATVHFADWLPTLLAVAGLTPPPELALDGQNALPLLHGADDTAAPPRFWQWNRYTPLVTSNAAIRDGAWKLVRPAIHEAMRVAPEDLLTDRRLKYEPEAITDIERGPEPPRTVPPPPPPLLFDLAHDPYERDDRAAAHPERAATMLRALEAWFASVEADRATIPA